jgi:hypothetical protein
MSSTKKTNVVVAITVLALAGLVLSGCSLDRWVKVEPGEYTVLREPGMAQAAAAREIETLQVDRETQRVAIRLVDGSEIVTSFVPRERSAWPSGCPANIQSTRMEVLELEVDPLTIGATTFQQPVLVRDCPRDPMRLVLRSDGVIGGGGTACPYLEPCIYFAR